MRNKERTIENAEFELRAQYAPEQFAEPGDPGWVYGIHVGDELVWATDEGWDIKQMVKGCRQAAKFFEQAAEYLNKVKPETVK